MRLAFLPAALLAACATTPAELAEFRDSWRDAAYGEVVLRWGTPSRGALLPDGRDSHTWISESAGARAGGGAGMGTGVMFGAPGGESLRCERTLVFREGRVVDQIWRGAPEYCREFRRGR